VPEGTGHKCGQAGTEAGLLALRSDAQIDVVTQPVVCVFVPAPEVAIRILGGFKAPRVDIFKAVPEDLAGLGIETIVSHSGQDTGTLGEGPDTVVLEASGKAEHVDDPHAARERIRHEGFR